MLGHSASEQRIADTLTRLQAQEDLAAELELSDVAGTGVADVTRGHRPDFGPRTLEHLTGSFPAIDFTLEPETLARLNELFPGPSEAPMRLPGEPHRLAPEVPTGAQRRSETKLQTMAAS